VKKRWFQSFRSKRNLHRYSEGRRKAGDPLPDGDGDAAVGLSLPVVRFGYMDHTGYRQLVSSAVRPTRVVTPGCVRLVTWTMLALIKRCFDCKITW
jgi:hypothetical protein